MAKTPPFLFDEANPLNSALVSTYPANERDMRDNINSWTDFEHGSESGRHKIPTGNDAARDAITDWEKGSLWISTQGTLPSLQINNGTKATPDWEDVTGITTVGDLIQGVSGGMAARLAIGAAGTVLGSNGTVASWGAKSITTRGDILRGDSSGDEERLAVGAAGEILKSDGTDVAWAKGGRLIQVVNVQDGAVATGTTVLPFDDTIPQITEGDEYMTLVVTPTNSSNILEIEIIAHLSITPSLYLSMALFQDAVAGALAATSTFIDAGQGTISLSLRYRKVAGTTSATTFRLRAGGTGGTTTFNGVAGARRFGGVSMSSINIKEISV